MFVFMYFDKGLFLLFILQIRVFIAEKVKWEKHWQMNDLLVVNIIAE